MRTTQQIGDVTWKQVDDRGRISLGQKFANKMVQVQQRDGDVLITMGRFVPEREAWLYENPQALEMVRRGLKESIEGAEPAPPPDLAADLAEFEDVDEAE